MKRRAFDQRNIGRRPYTLDNPMYDGFEQRGLVGKAVIEGSLGDARLPSHRLDRRQSVPMGEE